LLRHKGFSPDLQTLRDTIDEKRGGKWDRMREEKETEKKKGKAIYLRLKIKEVDQNMKQIGSSTKNIIKLRT
jgi:hypothetical protein